MEVTKEEVEQALAELEEAKAYYMELKRLYDEQIVDSCFTPLLNEIVMIDDSECEYPLDQFEKGDKVKVIEKHPQDDFYVVEPVIKDEHSYNDSLHVTVLKPILKEYKCSDCGAVSMKRDNQQIEVGKCDNCGHPLWN